MKKCIAIFMAAMMSFGMAACSSGTDAPSNGNASSQTPAETKDTLRIAYPTDPEGFDPQRTAAVATFNVSSNIYDTLLAVTPEWEIEDRLAESHSVSEDGRSITFKLREGVLFHDGTELTADDVLFTFQRLKDDESPKSGDYANIVQIEKVDDYTVTFTTDTLDVDLENLFVYPWTAIVPEGATDLKTKPVGTGAYKFVEWIPQQQITLVRNDDYFLGAANIPNLELYLMTDATSMLAALQVGDIDITEITGDQVEILGGDENFQVYAEPMNAIQLLALNLENEALSDLRVRQAIGHAIDKQAIIDAVIWGYGDEVGSHLPIGSPDYIDTTDVIPYDPEASKALLAEAGYADGLTLSLTLPKSYQIHVDVGQIIADQLSQVGITVNINIVEWAEWLSEVYGAKNYDMTVMAHSGRLDSRSFLTRYHSQSGDYLSLITGEVDALLEQLPQTTDAAARKEMYAQIQTILAEQLPAVYVQTPNKLFGMAGDVQGFRVYPIDIYEYRNVSFAE